MTTAYVALGSNVGKRQTALRAALSRLGQIPRTTVTAVATFRQTQPVDCPPEMPAFINSAAEIETSLEAPDFLVWLLQIERDLGRQRSPLAKHEARTIDLDLIFFGESILTLPDLVIPHPRMQVRRFVLEPLAEIAPEFRHPLSGKTMRELLHALDSTAPVERIAG